MGATYMQIVNNLSELSGPSEAEKLKAEIEHLREGLRLAEKMLSERNHLNAAARIKAEYLGDGK